jgi:hypothetical protein
MRGILTEKPPVQQSKPCEHRITEDLVDHVTGNRYERFGFHLVWCRTCDARWWEPTEDNV